jgi:UDP-N-acetylglucosamine:LPS N-acetylglucosamine transferase
MKKEKYLLIYLKTGGGHLAPAKSIAAQLVKLNPSIEPILIDGFKKAPWIVKFIVVDGYRRLQYKAKWFYEFLYAINKFRLMAWINASIISFFTKDYINEVIQNEQPSRIIIFHFFMIKPVYDVLSKNNLHIKTNTVVTDPFTAHPLWFLKKDQDFVIFSSRLKNHCLSIGIKENRLKVLPFILDNRFSAKATPEEIILLRNKYKIESDKKVILVLGGGDGIPRGKKILSILLNNKKDFHIILIAGNNESLKRKAIKLKEQKRYQDFSIYGYVDFVYDLINLSDVVITKCGASTFMEIIISGKIPLVTNYIWEQEKGNKDYIVQNGMGVYVKNLNTLSENIEIVFRNREFYQKNIEKAHLKNGAEETARYLSS